MKERIIKVWGFLKIYKELEKKCSNELIIVCGTKKKM